jgi:hypothetical protein
VKQEEQKTAGALFDFWQMKAMLNVRETLGHNEFVAMAMSFFSPVILHIKRRRTMRCSQTR